MDQDFEYCRTQTETHNRDRYILSLAAPAHLRPALWAVFAFNHEIAKTREIVRDAAAGHLRLAWWREALNKFYLGDAMPAHEVAQALGHAIKTHALAQNDFEALIDARVFDLDGTVPASLDGLAAYAAATNAPLWAICAKILGVPRNDDLATAWGLIGTIRALPFAAARNRCFLPLPMLHDMGLMPEQFHHLKSSPALRTAVKTIAQRAQDHLGKAQADTVFFKRMEKICLIYLKRIAAAQYDPFDVHVHGPAPFLGLRVLF